MLTRHVSILLTYRLACVASKTSFAARAVIGRDAGEGLRGDLAAVGGESGLPEVLVECTGHLLRQCPILASEVCPADSAPAVSGAAPRTGDIRRRCDAGRDIARVKRPFDHHRPLAGTTDPYGSSPT
jgi:hypothetical protein